MTAARLACSPVRANASLGAFRTHMFGYLLGETLRDNGGKIYIRCDDTDRDKGTDEEFQWFLHFIHNTYGMHFDALPGASRVPVYPSERTLIYDDKLTQLLDRGIARREPHSRAVMFDVEKYVELYGEKFFCEDIVLGKIGLDLRTLLKSGRTQFALRRSDGKYLYHFTAPVDDGEMGITHVSRGQDKLSVLTYHDAVKRSLGYSECKYFHLPLLLDKDGALLGGDQYLIPGMIDRGCSPAVIISYLFSSCHSHQENLFDLVSMKEVFDPRRVSRSNAMYDARKLQSIERKYVATCSLDAHRSLVEIYVRANDPELALEIDRYPKVLQILALYRMQLSRMLRVARALLRPVYNAENMSLSFRRSASEAIRTLLPGGPGPLWNDRAGENVVRWVLTGSEDGIPCDAIVRFLTENSLMDHRLSAASASLNWGLSGETP